MQQGPSYREGVPDVQCLEHLDWEMDKMWSSYLTGVLQRGANVRSGLADLAAPVVAV